ncbi:hypothetical protein PCAR4_390087 [Paraburkholderia caribensis]|nr:hypothetical protein PCAR4_390087 [Paraburkholderia caribensis]
MVWPFSLMRGARCDCGIASAKRSRSRCVSRSRSSAPRCRCPALKLSRLRRPAWPPIRACTSCLNRLSWNRSARSGWPSSMPKCVSAGRRSASATYGSRKNCAIQYVKRNYLAATIYLPKAETRSLRQMSTIQTAILITNDKHPPERNPMPRIATLHRERAVAVAESVIFSGTPSQVVKLPAYIKSVVAAIIVLAGIPVCDNPVACAVVCATDRVVADCRRRRGGVPANRVYGNRDRHCPHYLSPGHFQPSGTEP